jgi:cytochrome oxidase Cu insertion factor (SCO1/SenC/PrrC family)
VAAKTRLVAQNGHSFTLGSLKGTVVVLAPFMTLCQETCPMTSTNIRRAALDASRSGRHANVRFIEVTVDPWRDSVPRLRAYQALFGRVAGWTLATGRPRQVVAFWKALGVATRKKYGHDRVRDWLTGKVLAHPYDVQHNDVVMLLGPSGHIRWMTEGVPDAGSASLPPKLESFLNEEGRGNLAHPGAHGSSTWSGSDIDEVLRYARSLTGNG